MQRKCILPSPQRYITVPTEELKLNYDGMQALINDPTTRCDIAMKQGWHVRVGPRPGLLRGRLGAKRREVSFSEFSAEVSPRGGLATMRRSSPEDLAAISVPQHGWGS